MDILFLVLLLLGGFQAVKAREQRRRIGLLGGYLQRYRIEKLMETLLEGYLRALGEGDAARREQVWQGLAASESELQQQLQQLATDMQAVWGDDTLVSTLPVALPYADKLFPRSTFDLRRALLIHAEGISAVVRNDAALSKRDQAYTLTAEMLLLQHTCHWYCRSRAVASARMLARHQTTHAQAVAAVSQATRAAYRALTTRG